MTYVLGVDPGHVSGWALLDPSGKPIEWGQTGKPGQRTTGNDIAGVVYDQCTPRPLVLAIEGQFVLAGGGKGERFHGQTLSTLKTARIRGMWEAIVESDQDTSLFSEDGIQPATWRSAVWGGRWTSAQAKHHSVEMAAHTWGIRMLKTHHHTAEAIWIARYAWGEMRQRKLGVG